MTRLKHGCVYVAISGNGIIKVGRTDNPKTRAVGIKRAFEKLGTNLVRIKLCDEVRHSLSVESELIKRTQSSLKTSHGREWFLGGDFDAVFSVADELTKDQGRRNIERDAEIDIAWEQWQRELKEKRRKKTLSFDVFTNIFHSLISEREQS